MVKSQVVKSRGSLECEAGEVVFPKTALIPYAPHCLGGFNEILHLYSDREDIHVECYLSLIKNASPRFLELREYCCIHIVTDICGVLIQDTVLRYGAGHVREPLVLDSDADHLADRQDCPEDSCDDGIPHNVHFFAVFIFLIIRVYKSWNLSLGAVMEEYVRPVSVVQIPEKSLEGRIVGLRHPTTVRECLVKNRNEAMRLVAYLGLGHAEPVSKDCLDMVVPENVDNETEPILQGRKRTVFVIARKMDPLTRLAVDLVISEIFVMLLCEIWYKVIEILQTDACQCSEGSGILAENLEIDDDITESMSFLCLRVIIKNE